MFELYDAQQKRILGLSVAALIFAIFAIYQIASHLFVDGEFVGLFTNPTLIFQLCCVILMAVTVLHILIRSSRDHQELHHRRLHDEATSLPNETFLEMQIATQLEEHQFGDGFGLINIDIDRLKSVNESMGHDAGDVLIGEVARRLSEILYGNKKLFKLPGGQFTFLMPSFSDPERLCIFADDVFERLNAPFIIQNRDIYMDVSIGASCITDRSVKANEVIRRSEFALLQAKKKGGNRLMMYDEGIANDARYQGTMETELRELLENEKIELVFQPLINGQTNIIGGLEALARWNHPDQGYISPASFIPVAEKLGLLQKLGSQMLRQACLTGAKLGELTIAVNISPDHFLSDGFILQVLQILEETGLAPNRLELEITENVFLADSELAITTMKKLRSFGISIALDDFGAGYSGLSYLNRFDVDRIKIDASFIRELETSPASRSIVSTMIHLGQDRGFSITIEGIETEQQLKFLAQFEDLWYQGYLFSKPLQIEQIEHSDMLENYFKSSAEIAAKKLLNFNNNLNMAIKSEANKAGGEQIANG